MKSDDQKAFWDAIINFLNGSCNSLTDALQTFDAEDLENDMEFLEYLDEHIMICDCCQW